MGKNFKPYVLIWTIGLVVFNTIVFLVEPVIPHYQLHYDTRFWIAWLFIITAFIGNLLCAYKAFQTDNLEKLFYRLSLINVSYTGLLVVLVLGTTLMLIPNCPKWIAAIVCVAVTAWNVVALIKANWAGEVVASTHIKTINEIQFIKQMTENAEEVLKKAPNEKAGIAAKKVYEALRYSDPTSSNMPMEMKAELEKSFKEFRIAIDTNEHVPETADRFLELLSEWNGKCKAMK